MQGLASKRTTDQPISGGRPTIVTSNAGQRTSLQWFCGTGARGWPSPADTATSVRLAELQRVGKSRFTASCATTRPPAFRLSPLHTRACVPPQGQPATAAQRRGWRCTCVAVALALLTVAGPASADCIDAAAHRFGTNSDVLRAIALVESHARCRGNHRGVEIARPQSGVMFPASMTRFQRTRSAARNAVNAVGECPATSPPRAITRCCTSGSLSASATAI